MSIHSWIAGECREPHCDGPAGSAGYCARHLASALRRCKLDELVDVLEDMVDMVLADRDGKTAQPPLLN